MSDAADLSAVFAHALCKDFDCDDLTKRLCLATTVVQFFRIDLIYICMDKCLRLIFFVATEIFNEIMIENIHTKASLFVKEIKIC